ncbi:MAG TPA: hypothetical protein EYQ27_21010 [Gemmatimonadetes bacterium]|nr:hypothetical protein [Gemmatimonadota bacterium]
MTAWAESEIPSPCRGNSPSTYSIKPGEKFSDGERFVILTNNPDAPAREIRVIQNFFEELKRLVPN